MANPVCGTCRQTPVVSFDQCKTCEKWFCGSCGHLCAEAIIPGEGEMEVITRERVRHSCGVCGEAATFRITYLLDNCRRNPASKAYGRDDCSWCADDEAFACEAHKEETINHPPDGMGWCSAFDGRKMPHMLLYWKEVSKVKSPAVV